MPISKNRSVIPAQAGIHLLITRVGSRLRGCCGEADFRNTVLVGTISQAPVATVTFNDQGTYGNTSCTVDFFDHNDVEFKFSATAFYNGYPLSDVGLMAELDAGGVTHDTKEDTNFNGVADFTMEVLVSNITQTPLATVTFDDEDIYGNAFCTIHSATSDAFWAAVIERATNGK